MSEKLDSEIIRHLTDLSAAIENIRITFLRMHGGFSMSIITTSP